jgi:hypothetical protein
MTRRDDAATCHADPDAESPQPRVLRSHRAEVADARRAAEPKTVAARDGLRHWRPKALVLRNVDLKSFR